MKNINYLIISVLLSLSANSFAQYANLYIVGNACSAGWDPGAALEMSQTSTGVFEWTGNLQDYTGDNGQRGFKFLTQRGWENSITVGDPNAPNKLISSGVEEPLRVNTGGNDNRFQAPENGEYTIVVNLNTMTMVCTKEAETPDLNHLFLIGNATPWGWDYGTAMPEMTKQAEGIFTWWGTLSGDNHEFKFMNERNTWDKSIHPKDNDVWFTVGEEYDLVYRPLNSSSNPPDTKFKTTRDGKYFVYADLKNMRAMIDSISTDRLYIVGGATPHGWDNGDNMEAMTATGNGLFEWTGFLNVGSDRQLKFLCRRSNWGKSLNAFADTELELNHAYNLNYRPKESGPNDFKFFVQTEGYYKIMIDLNNLTMEVSIPQRSDFVIEPNETKTKADYEAGYYGNIILKSAGGSCAQLDLQGGTLAVNGKVILQKNVASQKWYSMGLPFATDSVCTDAQAYTDGAFNPLKPYQSGGYGNNYFGDYWLGKYVFANPPFEFAAEQFAAGRGYIVQYCSDLNGSNISFISDSGIVLSDGVLNVTSEYQLLVNPTYKTLSFTQGDGNRYYYQMNSDGTAFVKPVAGTHVNIAPFEAVIAIQTANAASLRSFSVKNE